MIWYVFVVISVCILLISKIVKKKVNITKYMVIIITIAFWLELILIFTESNPQTDFWLMLDFGIIKKL